MYSRYFWRYSSLPKDYNPQVLPNILCRFILSELIMKAEEDAKSKGEKFNLQSAKKNLETSITSHLKNMRQAHRPEIVENMKVNYIFHFGCGYHFLYVIQKT